MSDSNRSTTPASDTFREFITQGWAPREDAPALEAEVAPFAAARRAKVSAAHPGERIVIAAGEPKPRSNDVDYPYRAHTSFTYLTGWGSDTVPGAKLVLDPVVGGHEATLYFREGAGRDTDEFYANSAIGEFWTGPRPSLAHVSAQLDIPTKHIDEFEHRRGDFELDTPQLAQELSELRLVKDEWEIQQIREAVAATARGFDDIIQYLDRASEHPRGERIVEGAFHARARLDGNAVGYDTIAASGAHACILHWVDNDGPVTRGDLILVDAGVEVDSLYTADITRTMPIDGAFTEVQRRVYEAVRKAADVAFSIVRPGITFRAVHDTALRSIAVSLDEWGLLPMSLEDALQPGNQPHRRYMVHGTSHHLGLDVHDCAQARREMYLDGIVEPGMVFTIEPGLYFQPDDLTVPEEYRGIGVRIEDDILVTQDGAENLSIEIPRTADDVEAWMRRVRG
ncbi:aminopeptidase P family protein [Gulosibacter molinativorax]|uniref:Xaa-Pro aminopeptidase n=1 Tax=Gulosibacter molinativorax TaxID=256821 RepID=A0ABT7C729_9MICO|nr:aminopeptidase P family protein [Gulosibacter molinativorax]MDJ1370574.1 peptidase M24 family protein [Gulosibacter molinativorax]QUY62010.1 Aminopeptidase P [Gulosibacter molinativorax]